MRSEKPRDQLNRLIERALCVQWAGAVPWEDSLTRDHAIATSMAGIDDTAIAEGQPRAESFMCTRHQVHARFFHEAHAGQKHARDMISNFVGSPITLV